MMNTEGSTTIKKICFDIFGQLAFMFGEELEKDDVECPEDNFIKAVMTFAGHKNGSIEIIIPTRLAPALAYNILGIDDSDPMESEIAEDALKELLNTLCGRMLPALYTDQETFDLHPPEVDSVTRQQWQEFLNHENTIAFAIEDRPVLLKINLAE